MRLSLGLIALGPMMLMCAACGEHTGRSAAVVAEPAAPRRPIVQHKVAGGPAAFDLLLSREGATLIWGVPAGHGPRIRYQALGSYGEALSVEGEVLLGTTNDSEDEMVREVVGTFVEGNTYIAWASRGPNAQTRWAYAGASLTQRNAMSSARALHVTQPVSALSRGSLAITTGREGQASLLVRYADERCAGSTGRRTREVAAMCATLFRYSLFEDGRAESDAASKAVLPETCEMPLIGAEAFAGTMFHAYGCNRERGTTFYSVRRDAAYAAAATLSPGCNPRAMAPSEHGAILIAGCPQAQITEIDASGVAHLSRTNAFAATCDDHTMTLRAGDFTLRLSRSTPNLAAWLPSELVANNARAVWTGHALLVAEAQGTALTLRRFECTKDGFERTDL